MCSVSKDQNISIILSTNTFHKFVLIIIRFSYKLFNSNQPIKDFANERHRSSTDNQVLKY